MQKVLSFMSITAFMLLFGMQISMAQSPTESLAGMNDEAVLEDAPSIAIVEKVAPLPTETPIQLFEKQMQNPIVAEQVAKVNKFLNSKVGKWVVKRAIAKAERKSIRKAKKNPDFVAPDKGKETQKLSGNMRIAAILGIIGIICTIVGNDTIRLIGLVLILIALILLLIELI